MPFAPKQMLAGIVLPAVLLSLAILPAWRPWNRRAGGDGRWIFGPVIGLGFCIAYVNFELKLGWPPNSNVVFLLFYLAIPIAICGLLDAIYQPPFWLRAIVLLLIWRLFVRLLLMPLVPREISGSGAELWIDVIGLIALGWWLTFEHLADRSPGAATPTILAAICIASAILLAMGWHIQASGVMAGALVAMSAAGMILSIWNSRISFSRGFAQTIALLLLLLLVHGYFYTDDALTGRQQLWAGLLLVSPLAALVGDLPMFRGRHRAVRLASRIVPVLILLTISCGETLHDYLRADQAHAAMQDE
jgi:hypothetical protein